LGGGGGKGGRRRVGFGAAEEGRVFARHGDGGLELSKRRREGREVERQGGGECEAGSSACLLTCWPFAPAYMTTIVCLTLPCCLWPCGLIIFETWT
jgi:hypothetical protein